MDDFFEEVRRLVREQIAIAEQRRAIALKEAAEIERDAKARLANAVKESGEIVASARANSEEIRRAAIAHHADTKAKATQEAEIIVASTRENAAEIEKAAARQQREVTKASGAVA